MQTSELFSRLWDSYVAMTPEAARIRARVESRFGPTENDHVAFRTFDREGIALEDLESAFLDRGYERGEEYRFVDKHLRAFGYEPPEPGLPLVFISELERAKLSPGAQAWIEAHPPSRAVLQASAVEKLLSGRSWELPTWKDYQALEQESPYTAWLSVFGLCANHFTIAVHRLRGDPALEQIVLDLKAEGISMNEVGGLIKGSPGVLLEQASTLAEPRPITFACGQTRSIPSSYYEFAKRYRDQNGDFYRGFVEKSAQNIFESTTEQRKEP